METLLKQHRESLGLALAKVAEATGIHRTTLYRIEAAEITPSQKNARKLFDYYEGRVPLAHIYDPVYAVREALNSADVVASTS